MKYSGLLGLLLLTGCAANRAMVTSMGRGVTLSVMPIPTTQPLTYIQDFEIVKDGKPFRFNGLVEMETNRIAMVGLTPVGNRGFSVVVQDGAMDYEHLPFYRLPLKPAELLTLWQLMFQDTGQTAPILNQAGLTATEVHGERHYHAGKHLLLRVLEEGPDRRTLHHAKRGYSLTVITRSIMQ